MELQEVLSGIYLSLFQSRTISDTEERTQVLTTQDRGQDCKKDCGKGETTWDLDQEDKEEVGSVPVLEEWLQ